MKQVQIRRRLLYCQNKGHATPRLSSPQKLREPLRLPPHSFTYYWTLSSKFFSIFRHRTCLLSVSGSYLGLRGVYLALWAALPSNPTLGKKSARKVSRLTGLSPSTGSGHCQVGLWLADRSSRRLSRTRHSTSPRWAAVPRCPVPVSFAITKGITVVFFSSAY